ERRVIPFTAASPPDDASHGPAEPSATETPPTPAPLPTSGAIDSREAEQQPEAVDAVQPSGDPHADTARLPPAPPALASAATPVAPTPTSLAPSLPLTGLTPSPVTTGA